MRMIRRRDILQKGKVKHVDFDPANFLCLLAEIEYDGNLYTLKEHYESEVITSFLYNKKTGKHVDTRKYKFSDLFKIGNDKLPHAVFNIGSASDCEAYERGECQLQDGGCYAYRDENMYKFPLWYRRRQEVFFRHMTAMRLAELMLELIGDKASVLRFNEAGEFRSVADVEKVNSIAMYISYYGIKTYTYSARMFDWDTINIRHVTVIGSDRLGLDGQFIAVKGAEEAYKILTKIGFRCMICPADCNKCSACPDNKKNKLIIIAEKH